MAYEETDADREYHKVLDELKTQLSDRVNVIDEEAAYELTNRLDEIVGRRLGEQSERYEAVTNDLRRAVGEAVADLDPAIRLLDIVSDWVEKGRARALSAVNEASGLMRAAS